MTLTAQGKCSAQDTWCYPCALPIHFCLQCCVWFWTLYCKQDELEYVKNSNKNGQKSKKYDLLSLQKRDNENLQDKI